MASIPRFKHIVAVAAGFITVFILSIVTDIIFESAGIFPGADQPEMYTWWMLLIALIYRSAITVLGGYVTARLSPNNAMRNVVILGILGTIGGTVGVIVAWSLGNHWYPIALAVTALPLTYWGGKLHKRI